MSIPGLLIVGASQAGVQLAVSARALGYEGAITLLSDEDHRPYQRPALSKEYLQGKYDKEKLIFRSNDYWENNNITLVKNSRVARVEKNADGSGIAFDTQGREFPFSRLALTVGARARLIEVPGAELNGVVYLRNADDALHLKALLPSVREAVVIGGGFIGLEAACSLQDMGLDVTVVERGPRLIGRAVGEETSDFFLDAHTRRGLDIRLDAGVQEIHGDTQVTGVTLDDGSRLSAQLVIIGIGVIPNTELAEQLGLEVDNGIVVDSHAVASDGVTLAVGDVANLPNPVPGSPADERIRIESVNNAIEHAKVAAYSMVGQPEAYAGIPWFWSNQGDLKLQIAGLSHGFDHTVIRRDYAKKKFSVLYYRGDQIVAADCVNHPLDFMAVRAALSKEQNIPAAAAADSTVPLKTLITKKEPA